MLLRWRENWKKELRALAACRHALYPPTLDYSYGWPNLHVFKWHITCQSAPRMFADDITRYSGVWFLTVDQEAKNQRLCQYFHSRLSSARLVSKLQRFSFQNYTKLCIYIFNTLFYINLYIHIDIYITRNKLITLLHV